MMFVLTETLKVLPEPDSATFGFGSRAPQTFQIGEVVDGEMLADGKHILVKNKYKIPTTAINKANAVGTPRSVNTQQELDTILAATFQATVVHLLQMSRYDIRYIGEFSAKYLQKHFGDIEFFQSVVKWKTGYKPNEVDCAIIWHNFSRSNRSDWSKMTYDECAIITDEIVDAALSEQVT